MQQSKFCYYVNFQFFPSTGFEYLTNYFILFIFTNTRTFEKGLRNSWASFEESAT